MIKMNDDFIDNVSHLDKYNKLIYFICNYL